MNESMVVAWERADFLSIDQLVEIAGYGYEWVIESGHVKGAVIPVEN